MDFFVNEKSRKLVRGEAVDWWRLEQQNLAMILCYLLFFFMALVMLLANRDMLWRFYNVNFNSSTVVSGEIRELVSSPFFCTGTESGDSAIFVYAAGGKQFEGVYPVNPRIAKTKLGANDAVEVRYLTSDPSVSIIEGQVGNSSAFVGAWMIGWFFLIGILGTLWSLRGLKRRLANVKDGSIVDAQFVAEGSSWQKGMKTIEYSFRSPKTNRTLKGKSKVPKGKILPDDPELYVTFRSDDSYHLL